MRYLFYILVTLLIAVGCYFIGVHFTQRKYENTVINNYGYVREIAELASLEVNGTAAIRRSNLEDDDASMSGIFKKMFLEQTVSLSVPFTAKYGVNMKDSSFKILRKDSVVAIYLPPVQLLSFELYIDRMQANNKKGWLIGTDEELYSRAQQKMYKEARTQLAANAMNLQQSQAKISKLLTSYFQSVGLKAVCYFHGSDLTLKKD